VARVEVDHPPLLAFQYYESEVVWQEQNKDKRARTSSRSRGTGLNELTHELFMMTMMMMTTIKLMRFMLETAINILLPLKAGNFLTR
jgi:hypothetical protein